MRRNHCAEMSPQTSVRTHITWSPQMKTGPSSESLPSQHSCHQTPNLKRLHVPCLKRQAWLAQIGCNFIACSVMWLLCCVVWYRIDVSHVIMCANADCCVVMTVALWCLLWDVCCVMTWNTVWPVPQTWSCMSTTINACVSSNRTQADQSWSSEVGRLMWIVA